MSLKLLLYCKFKRIFLINVLRTLRFGLKNNAGRSKYGFIVSFKKSKKPYRKVFRFIDFWKRINNYCYVLSIDTDPNRSSFIALVCYLNGLISYTLHVDGVFIGSKLYSGDERINNTMSSIELSTFMKDKVYQFNDNNFKNLFLGYTMLLSNISVGTIISGVELWPGKGIQVCRAAGVCAILLKKENGFALLKLNSGWKIYVSELCIASIGIISNINNKYKNLNKAGTSCNLGRKQTVRGVAMNSVDHPHGGGRGKSSGKRDSKSPWGKSIEFRITSRNKNIGVRKIVRFR